MNLLADLCIQITVPEILVSISVDLQTHKRETSVSSWGWWGAVLTFTCNAVAFKSELAFFWVWSRILKQPSTSIWWTYTWKNSASMELYNLSVVAQQCCAWCAAQLKCTPRPISHLALMCHGPLVQNVQLGRLELRTCHQACCIVARNPRENMTSQASIH